MIERRSSLNDTISHMHVQGPSTATCMALTAYLNICPPPISSAPENGCRLMSPRGCGFSHTSS